MILEEMPNFHLRPEWQTYRRRSYRNGAKRGTIQHAIFKDILVALRTIAGVNRRASKAASSREIRQVGRKAAAFSFQTPFYEGWAGR